MARLIVIDGLDASGKTTQAYRLASFLKSQGKSVCLRVHPSEDNLVGIHAKRFLQAKGKNAHFASAFFYMLDVIHSILLYSWRGEDHIIFVRYLLGTAYLPSPLDRIAYYFFATIVPKPEKTFFIDIKPEVAYNRIVKRTRDKVEMFEKPEALTKIRKKGLALASLGKWLIIDGTRNPAEIESNVRSVLRLDEKSCCFSHHN
ncbi:MAG TPA: thymidylate kinase [Candidatus Bathyarchaeia archaeon]